MQRGGVGREQQPPGGPRRTDHIAKRPDPAIPDDVTGKELDRSVWLELRTLSKENAEGVAKHLVMVARLLDGEPESARAHAETALRRAGRVPSVREAMGLVHYHEGEWQEAIAEFRTARRLSGSDHLLPYLVDCERGLGRLDRAIDLAQSPAAKRLSAADQVELAIVVSGIRRDQGHPDAAVAALAELVRRTPEGRSWAPRLYYAYGDALLEAGRDDEAQQWFERVVRIDQDLETDAVERLESLEGIVVSDALDEDADDIDDVPSASDAPARTYGQSDGVDDADAVNEPAPQANPEGDGPQGDADGASSTERPDTGRDD